MQILRPIGTYSSGNWTANTTTIHGDTSDQNANTYANLTDASTSEFRVTFPSLTRTLYPTGFNVCFSGYTTSNTLDFTVWMHSGVGSTDYIRLNGPSPANEFWTDTLTATPTLWKWNPTGENIQVGTPSTVQFRISISSTKQRSPRITEIWLEVDDPLPEEDSSGSQAFLMFI